MYMLNVGICPGLTKDVLLKLKEIRCLNVSDFIAAEPEQLALKSAIPLKDVLSIRRILLAQYSALALNGADFYTDVVSTVAILPTGCNSIDKLLDDGIYTAEVTEIIGRAGTGKTQLCISTAISVAKETKQNVIYFDTSNSFNINRIVGILDQQNTEQKGIEDVCSRIKCCGVFNVFELMTELENLRSSLASQLDPFVSCLKLVIVDCVGSVVSPILGGQHGEGHSLMMHVARSLNTLAVDHAIGIMVTNNMVSGGEHGKPALGRSWASVCSTRLQISKEQTSRLRHAKVVKSNKQPLNVPCSFFITECGLQSVE